ncbi:MAG: hypothetical protein MSIBF_02575 [Candidatus Altiarchaeales archaeon IMC4]|nr:MAG: hypothetical protein MSIBF_02575 [Candidatus Altiarchaeales archaeon IMC4]
MAFYDLHVSHGGRETAETAKRLGLSGICIVSEFRDSKSFGCFCGEVKTTGSPLEIFTGAEISGDLKKKSIVAVEHADLVFVRGDENAVRWASELWEVDAICPEPQNTNKKSGMDQVSARAMSERLIALEIRLSDILDVRGMARAQLISQAMQNIRIARRYKVPIILTSGAPDKFGMRAPREMAAVARMLGMSDKEANDCVSLSPLKLIEKSRMRSDPNVITAGLEVVKWGDTPPQNKKSGWY